MNFLWNKNISLLKKRFPELSELYKDYLLSPPKITFWDISTAKNGSFTGTDLSISPGIRLHSSYNPEREALNSITQKDILEKETVVFFGCGLGYHIIQLSDYLLKIPQSQIKTNKIVLIEPNPDYFFASLSLLDWTPVFQIQKLILAINCPTESIISLLEDTSHICIGNEGVSNAFFLDIPAFTIHSKNYFDTIKTIIQRNKSKNEINAATYKKFSNRWIQNSKKNLQYIQNCRTVNQFLEEKQKTNKQFNDCLIVAAGPSLEQIFPFIEQLKQKLTIICVETALHALLRRNIQPDFIIITDPQYYAYKHLSTLSSPESILICPISVYPSVFRFNCKEILLCSDFFPISEFFEKKYGEFGNLGAGGSVASSAWTFAYLLRTKNIYLAGLDLSFPSKQSHIKGSSAEQNFFINSSKTSTLDNYNCHSIFNANPEYGFSYDGKKVLTDSRMLMFAWWFESRIASCHETKTFSLCKSSLKIPGVEFINPAEVLSFSEKNNDNNIQVNQSNTKLNDFDRIKNLYVQQLLELSTLINKAVELCIIDDEKTHLELSTITKKIEQNSLSEILRLATPSSKDIPLNYSKNKKLFIYKTLQQEIKKYFL